VTVSDSTLSDNHADGSTGGGGIFNFKGTVTVSGSTLSGNTADNGDFGGGGIYNEQGTLTVSGSTLFGNTADNSLLGGGGILIFGGTVTLVSAIVVGNASATGHDINGPFNDNGHNLFGTDLQGSASAIGSGDLFSDTPLLAPLDDYGGPTQTLALLPGSPP